MKKLIGLVCALLMLFNAACAMAYTPGTYEAEALGMGMVPVTVTFTDDAIESIVVGENNETVGIGDKALEQLPELIVKNQSLGIDIIGGATITSNAVLEAVALCVEQAGGDVEALKAVPVNKGGTGIAQEMETDIVVIGAGLGGLSAAIAAREAGADVILLEKMSFVGGNSSQATGVIFFGGTSVQAAAGIEDSADAYYDFIMEKSEGKRDPKQVRMVADLGGETLDWMMKHGVQISDQVTPAMGCPVDRAHLAVPSSPAMIAAMENSATSIGVNLMLSTPAVGLRTDDNGRVIGVTAIKPDGDELIITAKNTIIAAGGFGANSEMIKEYWNMDLLYAGAMGNTGEMITAAMELGADTLDMSELYLTPTIDYTRNQLITSMVISKGAMLVDDNAQRYCDEVKSYFETSIATLELNKPYVYEIFDSHVKEMVYKVPDYINQGIVTEADTIEELAQKLGLDPAALRETVDTYNKAAMGEIEDPFGRVIFEQPCVEGPFYCIVVNVGTAFTVGGLKIDEECRVLKTDGTVLEGLYAVGESTGGYKAFGYISGEALAHAAVTGKVAGMSASADALQ